MLGVKGARGCILECEGNGAGQEGGGICDANEGCGVKEVVRGKGGCKGARGFIGEVDVGETVNS